MKVKNVEKYEGVKLPDLTTKDYWSGKELGRIFLDLNLSIFEKVPKEKMSEAMDYYSDIIPEIYDKVDTNNKQDVLDFGSYLSLNKTLQETQKAMAEEMLCKIHSEDFIFDNLDTFEKLLRLYTKNKEFEVLTEADDELGLGVLLNPEEGKVIALKRCWKEIDDLYNSCLVFNTALSVLADVTKIKSITSLQFPDDYLLELEVDLEEHKNSVFDLISEVYGDTDQKAKAKKEALQKYIPAFKFKERRISKNSKNKLRRMLNKDMLTFKEYADVLNVEQKNSFTQL